MSKVIFPVNSKTFFWDGPSPYSSPPSHFMPAIFFSPTLLGLTLIIMALFPLSAHPAEEQASATAVKEVVTGTVDIQQDTQEKKDRWSKEKARLEARYQSAKAHSEALKEQRAQLNKRIETTREKVQGLTRRLDESTRLEQGLQQIIEALLLRLETGTDNGLPFLPDERAKRLHFLKEIIAQEDISSSAKLRHLLEALQIESEYGDTVEVYQQQIVVEEQQIFADIFRLGRLSIFWRTPDGKRVGEYDRVTKQWVALPNVHKREILKAIEMANKRRPIELLELPIGRLAP